MRSKNCAIPTTLVLYKVLIFKVICTFRLAISFEMRYTIFKQISNNCRYSTPRSGNALRGVLYWVDCEQD